MPATITLILPLCPSTNELFANVPKVGRVKTGRYRTWLQAAGWSVNAARLKPIKGAVAVTIALPIAMPGDIDNRAKGALDLLVRHALIEDDRHVHALTLRRCLVGDAKEMVVTVAAIAAPRAREAA